MTSPAMSDDAQRRWESWLLGRTRSRLHLPEYRAAAVLVALSQDADPRLLLTVRSAEMPTHAGQIGFVGGGLKAAETPIQAALREAHEEVNLRPEQLRVLGELDDVSTPVGFLVTPVLALLSPDFELSSLHPSGEVAQILLPPLSELRAAEQIQTQRVGPDGQPFELYRYPWQGFDIWGMTGRIVHGLLAAP